MKNKFFPLIIIALVLISGLTTNGTLFLLSKTDAPIQSQTIALQNIGSDILAQGTIHSQNEATLHFQTGGKLTYLAVKAGDSVSAGQTIAQLDTYSLQRQLTAALNTYRSTRNTYDQSQQNAQNGNLQGQQRFLVDTQTTAHVDGTDVINTAVQRILDQNQATLDNSVINVELANYALQLATLTSPITGIITSEDVSVAGQNITPTSAFIVADPTNIVMRANVAASDIDFVSNGAKAVVRISGQNNPLTGTVVKIYPQKQILANGQEIYQVDIASSALGAVAKLDQTGSILIASNAQQKAVTVPTWTILGNNSIWVEENGKPILKTVTVGKVHGATTEITSGLTSLDRVIINPKTVAGGKYSLL